MAKPRTHVAGDGSARQASCENDGGDGRIGQNETRQGAIKGSLETGTDKECWGAEGGEERWSVCCNAGEGEGWRKDGAGEYGAGRRAESNATEPSIHGG